MRTERIEISLYEIGDRVLTPDGKGTIAEDQLVDDYHYAMVELDEITATRTIKGKAYEFETEYLIYLPEGK